jgi:hypothetical protein
LQVAPFSHGVYTRHSLFSLQVTVLNTPLGWHVTAPLPLYPASQVTITATLVDPVILPATEKSEWATCDEAQALALHVTVVNIPLPRHTALPLPGKPALQPTETACPVVPTILPIEDLSEFITCVALQGSAMLHVTPEYPAVQVQKNALTWSEQTALFAQGLGEQSSISIEQVVPL